MNSTRTPTFKDGKVEGFGTSWRKNGQKKEEGTYKADKLEGVWTEWDEQGNVTKTETYKAGKLVKKAYVTVIHNGVVVHHHIELLGPTGHRNVYRYEAHPPKGPLRLQDHGDLVRFRNIWARPIGGYDEA